MRSLFKYGSLLTKQQQPTSLITPNFPLASPSAGAMLACFQHLPELGNQDYFSAIF
jgi:hypothetical protein